MADRTVKVKLQAEIDGYRNAMREADRATAAAAVAIDRHGNKITGTGARMIRSAEVNREAWTTSGTALAAFGAAGVAALGLSAKAAIDWESAWTGVLKTVDGSADQLGTLEEGLRDMALRLPASAEEIAGVAEAAGQLGVKVGDVQAFTETMINLGETTNLTAEEAATALARIANIMGTTVSDVSRMGATIVDLGNNSATTEREIVELATRLAAAGTQAKLSEAEVFAFASALTSVGVESEAGGTAMSKVFTAIGDATRSGSDDLTTFARVAGVSTDEFKRAFEEDAAGAIALFIEGMGRMSSSGESTTEIFDELGLADERLKRSVLSLGSATGLLGDQLDIANGAWEANTALVEEAEKRYDTTAAKIQIAKNSLNEAAIVIGEQLLPMLAGLAEGVADVAQWFADLPTPVQNAITGIGGLTAAASLGAGAFLLLFPRLLDTVNGLKSIGAISPRAASGLSKVAATSAKVGAAAIAAGVLYETINALNDMQVNEGSGIGATTAALLDLADGAVTAEQAFSAMGDLGDGGIGWVEALTGNTNDVHSYADALRVMRNEQAGFWDQLTSGISGADVDQATKVFEVLDEALTSLAQSGATDKAADAIEGLGIEANEVADLLPGYSDALKESENQAELTGDATFDLAEETQTYSEALEENIGLLRDASGATMDEWDALTQYAEAVETATDALYDENEELIKGAATLDAHSEAGRANRDALGELAGSTWDWIDAGVAAGATTEDLKDRMYEGRTAFVEAAIAMGATKEEAEDLADSMGLVPDDLSISVGVTGMAAAERDLRTLRSLALNVPGATTVNAGDVLRKRGYAVARAGGGPVYGPGTSTSDSIPAMLSDGEYVHRAAAHEFWGTQAMESINRNDVSGVMAALQARGFAGGGSASYTVATPSVTVNPSFTGITGSDLDSFAKRVAGAMARGAADISLETAASSNRARAGSSSTRGREW